MNVQRARAEHNFAKDRVRPEEINHLDLACSQCGHVWTGIEEDGVPEPCIRPDCRADSDQIVRA